MSANQPLEGDALAARVSRTGMQANTKPDTCAPPGFWLRACATLIDLTAITVVIALTASAAASFERYVPIEWTVLVVYFLYNAVLVTVTSATLGKWLCGIKITRRNGRRISLPLATVRALAQTLSLSLLALPFLVVAARRSKRGWHDLVSGTQVQYVPDRATRRRWTVAALSVLVTSWVVVHAVSWTKLYGVHRAFFDDADAAIYDNSAPETLDAGNPEENRVSELTAWLSEHSQEPDEYLVDFASRHQVTIVGEVHGKKQYLEFLNDAIPDLYHKAGVRVIALECCRSHLDAQLERLVTADHYDSGLALDIARKGPWRAWGYKEHWDVLETVWRLNRSLSTDAEPLRLVGIFPSAELISLGLLKHGHLLRLFRLLGDLPSLILHDAHYARCVERQAFDLGRRTLVWVGANHSWKCCSSQVKRKGTVRRYFRMGAMLHGRYPHQVGTVFLHNDYSFPGIANLIDACLEDLEKERLAFDITISPLGSLTDSQSFFSRSGLNLPMRDYVTGYIVLAPTDMIESCEWWDGFITPRMFGLYKPYYEILCERALKDHEEANQYMRQGVHRM